MEPLEIQYFSDVLCVWAYLAQGKLDRLGREFGDRTRITHRFIPFFGSNRRRIAEGWSERGGYAGYGRYVREVAERFGQGRVHPEVWTRNTPPSSLATHLFLKAVQLLERQGELDARPEPAFEGRSRFEETVWRVRRGFFEDAENVARRAFLFGIAEQLALPIGGIERELDQGTAHAALAEDMEDRHALLIEGSPTWLLNEGRQKLYGNISYHLLAENVRALVEASGETPGTT